MSRVTVALVRGGAASAAPDRRRAASVRRRAAAGLAIAALFAFPAGAAAQCPQTTVADVEDEVMCVVCGTPLALQTEAPQAQREREFVRGLVEGCRSKDEIKAALVAEYGQSVLAVPEEKGFGLAAYVVPGALLALAGAVLAVAVVRWNRRSSRTEALPAAAPGTIGAGAGAAGAEAAGTEDAADASALVDRDRPVTREPSPRESARLQADLERYEL